MNLSLVTRYSSLVVKSPAKINWSLYVLNKRDDGYHNILSLMHCIGLYDTLAFEYSNRIELITDMDIPCHENLVYKAAVMLKEYSGVKNGAKITLHKEIPLGAGLGGGSGNAACTLTGLNKLWKLGLDKEELKAIGSKLGSDVPFFFECPLSIVQGRGEILTPLSIDIPYSLLLVNPGISVPTAWAYEKIVSAPLEATLLTGPSLKCLPPNVSIGGQGADSELTKMTNNINNIRLIYDFLRSGRVSNLNSLLHNDFEDIVTERHPVIRDLKEGLSKAGAIAALMSGSGSTVFGVFEDKRAAINASEQFRAYWNRVVETAVTSNE